MYYCIAVKLRVLFRTISKTISKLMRQTRISVYAYTRIYIYAYVRITIRVLAYGNTHIRVSIYAYYAHILVNVFLSGTVHVPTRKL